MHSHRRVLLAITAATLFASAALADGSTTSPGTLEISTTVAFNRSSFSPNGGGDSWTDTHLNAAAGVGRVMTPNLSLDGALLVQHRALGGNGQNGAGLSLGGTWNFEPQARLLPFLSLGLGALNYFGPGGPDKALLAPMVRMGFRTMFTAQHSLNVSLGYQHEVNSESAVGGSQNVFDMGIGVSMFTAR